jgi:drug/metabolite transporter, DME family
VRRATCDRKRGKPGESAGRRHQPWRVPRARLAVAAVVGEWDEIGAVVEVQRGLRRLTASDTTTIVLAEPVTASVLGVTVLHEPLGALAVAGVMLVVAGIGVLALPRSPSPATA